MPVRLSLARLILCGLALVAARVGLPSAAAVAGPQQGPPIAPPPAGAQMAVLKGRVTDKKGAPLPGARVRVAVPAADMRQVNPGSDHLRFEAQSGANGEYRLELPGVVETTKVSIDAMAPGYRRLAGSFMRGGDPRAVEVEPGREVEADLALEPARYYAGTVADEQGRPIAGVTVFAAVQSDRSRGAIERTVTGPDGAFELFNYPVEPPRTGDQPDRGIVSCSHPDYIESIIPDVYHVEGGGRTHLRVVLAAGRRVAGTVRDAAGRPVAGAVVKVTAVRGGHDKGTTTDAAGRFVLRGLIPAPSYLEARAYPIKQKLHISVLQLDADRPDLELKLEPIAFPKDLKAYDVLGMRLADVTPGLQAAYDLEHRNGAVILDPGPDHARLNIGDLAEGDEFWTVGDDRVGGLRDFVDRIIAETHGLDLPEYSVRVVFAFSRAEFDANSTQYLKLTRADLAQLKGLAERLKAEAK